VTRLAAMISVAVLSGTLTGCVAVWGSSYHVEAVSPTSTTIRYDAALMDSRTVVAHANEICGQYQKVAVPKSQRLGVVLPGGSIAEIIFACDTIAETSNDAPSPLADATFVYSPPPMPPQPVASPAPVLPPVPHIQAPSAASMTVPPTPVADPCSMMSCAPANPPPVRYVPVAPGNPLNAGLNAQGYPTQ